MVSGVIEGPFRWGRRESGVIYCGEWRAKTPKLLESARVPCSVTRLVLGRATAIVRPARFGMMGFDGNLRLCTCICLLATSWVAGRPSGAADDLDAAAPADDHPVGVTNDRVEFHPRPKKATGLSYLTVTDDGRVLWCRPTAVSLDRIPVITFTARCPPVGRPISANCSRGSPPQASAEAGEREWPRYHAGHSRTVCSRQSLSGRADDVSFGMKRTAVEAAPSRRALTPRILPCVPSDRGICGRDPYFR